MAIYPLIDTEANFDVYSWWTNITKKEKDTQPMTTTQAVPSAQATGKLPEDKLKIKLGESIWNLIKLQPKMEGLRTLILNKTMKWVPENIVDPQEIIDWLAQALWVPPPPPPPPAPKTDMFHITAMAELYERGEAVYERKIYRHGTYKISRADMEKIRAESISKDDFRLKLQKFIKENIKAQQYANIPIHSKYEPALTDIKEVKVTDITYFELDSVQNIVNQMLAQDPEFQFATANAAVPAGLAAPMAPEDVDDDEPPEEPEEEEETNEEDNEGEDAQPDDDVAF
jgi:hypothetical protein